MVSVLSLSVAVTFYISYVISPFLKLGLGINRRRFQLGIRWCHRIGAESKTRVGICFFVSEVSVLSLSVAVTFYISYVISPTLEHVLGIIQRRIQLGMQWCYPISAESKTRVAIRFFVTMVSVLFRSAVVTFYDWSMISPLLKLGLGINRRRI
jgi:hypothetical protein